jgi:FMN phosphatase YigB (HAD superfamily)
MYCDDIVCSSDVGKLKSEDPVGFFGEWLSRHRLGFSDSLLIDDRADNCAAFEKYGGKAVQWKMGSGDLSDVVEVVERWMRLRICGEGQAKEVARV